jgi:hypothetical protein
MFGSLNILETSFPTAACVKMAVSEQYDSETTPDSRPPSPLSSDDDTLDLLDSASNALPIKTPPNATNPQLHRENAKRFRTDEDREAKRERRKRKRQNRNPTERTPRMKDYVPQSTLTGIKPHEQFPVVATGFTGARVDAMRAREAWKLEELLDMGFDVFRWDGK